MAILDKPAQYERSNEGAQAPLKAPAKKGNKVVKYMSSTDHKVIGNLYMITSFAFFVIAGAMALVMRAELARPGLQYVSNEQYNQLFTMHGTLMLFLFATALFAGFANAIMPLQIGSPDVSDRKSVV